jgi:hypothetical protein
MQAGRTLFWRIAAAFTLPRSRGRSFIHRPSNPRTNNNQQNNQTAKGGDPLLWETDELVRIRQLHARSFGDKKEYLAARHLADYLGLAPVDQLHVPLPLHIVFLGFNVRRFAFRVGRGWLAGW